MIFQLVYKSTATRYFYSGELVALLNRSRAKNARLGLSGMLLYRDGYFLQLLEGEETAVRERYAVIAEDKRHKWVSLVMTGPSEKRDFADWTMGFRDLDQTAAAPEGWNSLMTAEDQPDDFQSGSSYAKRLLLGFRAG